MQVGRLLLLSLNCCGLLLGLAEAQQITQPPVNTTAALGTNATFSCSGVGDQIFWEVVNTQIITSDLVMNFASQLQVYAPLPTDQGSSELFVMATIGNNASLPIRCYVAVGGTATGSIVESSTVVLTVYAEPNPPFGLNTAVDGLNLVLTWREPFSLEGEELSYVVSITNTVSSDKEEVTVNTSRYALTEPIGERDCAEYQFTVFSKNDFSKSINAVTGRANIPTEPLLMQSSDVNIQVSLTSGASATISFNPRDPCPSYPVTSYNFTITDRDTNSFIDTIMHTSNASLIVNSGNGLVPNRVYRLVIEAENNVGSTLSEEIIFYTTGLQSSIAVMELNGSITVTCTFATGALSTGCQVNIFMMGSPEAVLSNNITRPDGASQVTENMVIPGLSENSSLLVRAAELLSGGGVSNTLFEGTIMVAALPTLPTTPPASTISTAQGTPTPFGSTFYFIIGAVGGAVVILLLLIILSVCVILSLRNKRSKRNRYITSSEELKDNYSYGSTPVLADGVHARSNTYDGHAVGPLYETIPTDKMHMGNGASAQPVPNPVYGGEVVHCSSKTAENPVYAEAALGQERHRATLLSQTSHTTDVSALNPVYSGSAVPLSPLSVSGSFSQVNQTPSGVPQPSPGGAAKSNGSRYEMKLTPPSQYATPNEVVNDRYTSGPGNSEQSPYALPQDSPTLPPKGGGAMGGATAAEGEGSRYHNTPTHTIPTNPETGYSTLSRENIVEPPPGPVPIYETIKVKDTRPPVRPDGDGVTLQTNKSYGLLMTDSQATTNAASPGQNETTITTTSPPRSPRSPSGSNPPPPLPPHSPPPQEPPPPPSPNDSQSQTS